MPEAIVKQVEKQCKAGKKPAICKDTEDCHACGEKVAAVVAAKRKKGQSIAGGSLDEVDVTHLHGLYSQEDLTYEPIDDGNGIWLRVLDFDAKMIDTLSGKPVEVSQEAIMAALPKWVSPLYPDIKANIDHNLGSIQKEFSREEFEFVEAKYEINDGLYLKVQPADSEIRGALLSKTLRPSPEFDIEEYEDVGDVVRPTGLGLMWEGNPVSRGSGAAAPSTIAIGGENVTDEPNPEPEPNVNAEQDPKPEPEPEPEPEEPSAEDKLKEEMEALRKEMAEMKTNYEAVLKDNEDQKEREREHIEKEKAKIIKKLPDGYPTDVPLDVMRKDLVMHEAQLKEAGKLVAKGPDFVERDDMLTGEMTEEMYQQAAAAEDKIMGDSEGFAAAAGGLSEFEYNKITGTHYQAPPVIEPKSKK